MSDGPPHGSGKPLGVVDTAPDDVGGGDGPGERRGARAYGEWAQGDFSRRELFDPNIEGVWAAELPDAHVDQGVEAFFASCREWLSTWEGFRLEAEAFLPAEDKVVVLVVLRGRGRGSGAEVATPAAHVWTMRLGRAVRVEAYMDRARALEAAGLSES